LCAGGSALRAGYVELSTSLTRNAAESPSMVVHANARRLQDATRSAVDLIYSSGTRPANSIASEWFPMRSHFGRLSSACVARHEVDGHEVPHMKQRWRVRHDEMDAVELIGASVAAAQPARSCRAKRLVQLIAVPRESNRRLWRLRSSREARLVERPISDIARRTRDAARRAYMVRANGERRIGWRAHVRPWCHLQARRHGRRHAARAPDDPCADCRVGDVA
jgi:hypothetical protein